MRTALALMFAILVGTLASVAIGAGMSISPVPGGTARQLLSATTLVDVAAATAPSSGQVLTATGSAAATWQTPSTTANALASATTTVNASSATAPTIGQALVATSATTATWQDIDNSRVYSRTYAWWRAAILGASTTVTGIGTTSPTVTSSGGASCGSTYIAGNLYTACQVGTSTALNNVASAAPGSFNTWHAASQPMVSLKGGFVSATDDDATRLWIGYFSAAPSASNTPAIHMLAIRWVASVDTYYNCCMGNGATACTPGTVVPTASSASPDKYSLSYSGSILTCTVNGSSWTHSTNAPTATTGLDFAVYVTNLSAGTARLFNIGLPTFSAL